MTDIDKTAIFQSQRRRLLGIGYRMLGSRSEADDLVQEAWLRWDRTPAAEITSPEAWLVTCATRLAIDRLRELQREREQYVGPWLPEPIVESLAPPADHLSEMASELSVALLALLERLAPEERAAFLLVEAFDTDYAELAQILGKSEAACRQIVSRARRRVHEEKPRVVVSESARRRLLERYVTALLSRDASAVAAILAEEATLTSDGGGRAKAALKIVEGAAHVARFVVGVLDPWRDHGLEIRIVRVNGELGLAVSAAGRLGVITSFETDGERILGIYSVLNPEKLARIDLDDVVETGWPLGTRA